MKKRLICSTAIAVVIFAALSANASSTRICAQKQKTSVNLRIGPGTKYPKGLVEVGSGGAKVNSYFRQRNYTIPAGEQVSVFKKARGTDGFTWYQVGTNQWVAWVRSSFVCRF